MPEFIKILESEITSTLEGLTGVVPTVKFNEESPPDIKKALSLPLVALNVSVKDSDDFKMKVAIPALLSTAISDMMLGGEGEQKKSMNEDDLDAIKEILSNILGSLSTALNGQKSMPNLSFKLDDIKYIKTIEETDFAKFTELFIYNVSIQSVSNNMVFGINSELDFKLGGKIKTENVLLKKYSGLTSEEMKNVELIKDVKLPIRVRIGSKKMLLKDVLNMDIGSVIELDQLANDPLEILVGDKIIAQGEVVIIDGNFGVQISKIGSKKERLEKLR
ncbi:MAG: flagellar motor switch protein FliY [Sulfurospirillum sp.]|nr:flagellar motor switch protein FliY [Sulfurospirillum sp.]MBL0703623.1 flagellar motor switch protein FliY [Sulfurospirillum sp.]